MDHQKLVKKGIYLEYATLTWNIAGVILLGWIAPAVHSVALIAFGFDTLLEIGASMVVIWELTGVPGSRQKRALIYLSISFLILGLYLLVQSGYNLYHRVLPAQSDLGMAWLTLTFIVMLFLAWKKHRAGKKINNKVLLTEGRVTLVDATLALIVLIGLLLTGWKGWWWSDPIAGLTLMLYCFWECRHTWAASSLL